MSAIIDFQKLCFKKLKAIDLFNEFLNFKDNDKWLTYINPDIEKITNGEYVSKFTIYTSNSYNPVVSYANTKDIILYMVIIRNLFPIVFTDYEYSFKNNELIITIDLNKGNRLVNMLLTFGIININKILIFSLIYVKKFIDDLSKNKSSAALKLNVNSENPVSLLKCMYIYNHEASYDLSINDKEFSKHTKPTDIYAEEMAIFTLFKKFTENCDLKPLLEVTMPSAIYFLIYSDYELKIKHDLVSNMTDQYNYIINTKNNNSLEKTIKEMQETDAFTRAFGF